ncbi:hypothetical protein NOC27_2293 [Nitrosococcus oceani AFC27]|nr:hypothetical protein NOC27_2293 [Nitrosococcus oceani AFC27]GEM20861.1 hypothetical protein NONS58_22840 [Nitrosococcus oceani]
MEIDFDEIQNERIRDARENLRYFVSCLLSIDELQAEIKRQLTSESA